MVKNLPANAGDPGSIPGARRSPGEEDDNSLHSVAHQRSLVGYSPWGQQRVRHDWATKHTCTQARRMGSLCSKDSNSLMVFRGRFLGKEVLKWVLKCGVNRVIFQECQSSTFWCSKQSGSTCQRTACHRQPSPGGGWEVLFSAEQLKDMCQMLPISLQKELGVQCLFCSQH